MTYQWLWHIALQRNWDKNWREEIAPHICRPWDIHIKHMVLISIKCPACPSCPWCLNHTPHHTVPVWTTHTLSISHANSFFSWTIDSCSCMHTQSSWLQLLSHLLMQKFRSKSCSKKWHQRRLQAPWERKRNVTIHSCFVAAAKKGKTVQSGEGNIAQKRNQRTIYEIELFVNQGSKKKAQTSWESASRCFTMFPCFEPKRCLHVAMPWGRTSTSKIVVHAFLSTQKPETISTHSVITQVVWRWCEANIWYMHDIGGLADIEVC